MYYPTLEEFKEKAKQGNLIPVYREILADMETPVSAFRKIGQGQYAFLLESVEGGEQVGRHSFMGSEPFAVFQSKGREVKITRDGETKTRYLEEGEDPLTALKELLEEYRFVPVAGLPRFCGGAVGYIGYDVVRFFERLPALAEDDLNLPDSMLVFTDTCLIFDRVRHSVKVLSNARINGDPERAYHEAVEKIEALVAKLNGPLPEPAPQHSLRNGTLQRNVTPEQFRQGVLKVKDYIAAGDAVQVVLSQRLSLKIASDPFDLYRALRSLNPSPYMYYLTYGDLKIIGSSPERLVSEEDGEVITRPIAGSRRRGGSLEEDEEIIADLLSDEKERAEHIMLVDLGRNDIGRVCEYGSVSVDELMTIEKYSHVIHIVSNVRGRLRPDCDQFDVLRACFPAGTLSGAPKVRAMEIIEELEPTRRATYGGAIGYFSFSGNMDTAITIRTITMKGDMAHIQVGAGIVADSDPQREHEECAVIKAGALLKAIEMCENGLT
ncbi:MAG: anthranilate synthase component I [Armatimonadetes bacterium]|nr:anthranilate synthase component I [Armatimonadota bacterium]NIO76164.1 anthranilate synthase component I [Armatimonadota bacterium]NIO98860.1 anthranilate synthase component I [Armatimonadota bacterium]